MTIIIRAAWLAATASAAWLTACASTTPSTSRIDATNIAAAQAVAARPQTNRPEASMFSATRVSTHRNGDDLLTAGLGIDGLRAATPPPFADPHVPTAAELRRRAIWSNWRGIADLSPGGGFGTVYGQTPSVPGREFATQATVPGTRQPHTVVLQVPDNFDVEKRCVVVAPASGSRGVYGAIAVAGPWALPRGCAVVYTDKGAGSDYFDLDADIGIRADGTPGKRGDGLAFEPDVPAATPDAPDTGAVVKGVAVKHAHSRDNPEADWGRHARQAAQFALHALDEALPDAAPFTRDNTRIIAVGLSNGGGAVLRAAELDGGWFDAVVAAEPNVYVDGHGGRNLYDYSTRAALLMPCALLDIDDPPTSPFTAIGKAMGALRCASLAESGMLPNGETVVQARAAHEQLRTTGWSDAALHAGALSVEFDLWRAVAVTYASAYGRYGPGQHPCGFSFAAQGADGQIRTATATERATWWPEGSGIPPGVGAAIVDPNMRAPDMTLAGVQCLRGLWEGTSADADRVRSGAAQIAASAPQRGVPVVVIHGMSDGLIPPAFTSAPYVAMARAAKRDVRYWQVRNAQHFDAFLAFPDYAARYVPMLPYVYAALDRVDAYLDGRGALPADAVIETVPRGQGKPLTADSLAMPE